jgi:predicted RNase H-like nuclease (RuvC/YqgF family)
MQNQSVQDPSAQVVVLLEKVGALEKEKEELLEKIVDVRRTEFVRRGRVAWNLGGEIERLRVALEEEEATSAALRAELEALRAALRVELEALRVGPKRPRTVEAQVGTEEK